MTGETNRPEPAHETEPGREQPLRKCPGCGAMIESDDVAHFDVHGDLESRVAALEKKPDEAPTGGQEKPGGSRFSFRTLMDDMNEGGNDAQEGETEGP